MEIWKEIPGFEGFYEVSQYGNVRSLDRIIVFKDGRKIKKKGTVLKPIINQDGYLNVQLSKSDHVKTARIHRLVAEAFILNPEQLPEVNHKDEDKTNNNVNNLEWCDRFYNCGYGTRNKRISHGNSKPVIAYMKSDPSHEIRFTSIKKAAGYFGVSNETVRQAIVYGWKCRGYNVAFVQGKEVVAHSDGFYFCR